MIFNKFCVYVALYSENFIGLISKQLNIYIHSRDTCDTLYPSMEPTDFPSWQPTEDPTLEPTEQQNPID